MMLFVFLSTTPGSISCRNFIAIKPETEKSGTKLPSNNPRIKFCNVSFRYPNCKQYVLKDCSFTICLPLREILALSDFDERFNDEKLRKACAISGADVIIKD